MKRIVFTVLVVALLLVVAGSTVLAAGPVQEAAEKYFGGGLKTIKAADLFANFNDGDTSNDPLVVDIRSAEDYAKGHIPGAINIAGKDLFTAENLAKLPTDGAIVLHCYSGQTASQSTAALNMAGYDAYNLLYAIPAWAVNDNIKYPFSPDQSGNYPVSTDPAVLEGSFEAPAPLGADVVAAAQAYFAGGYKALKAADLFANLNDGDTSNDPVLLDLRSAEDYALGHITGAANVGIKTLFTAENLAKLPADRPIVPYCYTGQTSSQAVAGLRLLGYDAWNLQFGLPAWAIVEGVSVDVWDASQSANYALEGVPAAAAAAEPAAAPAALPTTGAPFALPMGSAAVWVVVAGLGALGAGLALRRR